MGAGNGAGAQVQGVKGAAYQPPTSTSQWSSPSRRALSPRVIAENFTVLFHTNKKSTFELIILFFSRVTDAEIVVKKRSKRKSSLNQTSSGRD